MIDGEAAIRASVNPRLYPFQQFPIRKQVTKSEKRFRVKAIKSKGGKRSKALKINDIVKRFKQSWVKRSDIRKKSNRLTYPTEEIALSAFAVFFMQAPSFLSYQRDMEEKKRSNNARGLFKIEKIPCDQQIRNVLDQVKAAEINREFFGLRDELEHGLEINPAPS